MSPHLPLFGRYHAFELYREINILNLVISVYHRNELYGVCSYDFILDIELIIQSMDLIRYFFSFFFQSCVSLLFTDINTN